MGNAIDLQGSTRHWANLTDLQGSTRHWANLTDLQGSARHWTDLTDLKGLDLESLIIIPFENEPKQFNFYYLHKNGILVTLAISARREQSVFDIPECGFI